MVKRLCVPDSDFLISIIKEDDKNHDQAVNIYKKLQDENAKIIYPITAIIEAATALLRRYNLPQLAKALLDKYQNPEISVADIKQPDFSGAVSYFDPKASKKHTPFDCLILSIAKNIKADVILSFDDFYRNKGLKTAYDLVEEITASES